MARKKLQLNYPPLQPLRIPIGWTIKWNTFYELDPVFKTYDDNAWNFTEDMLLLENDLYDLIVDLGWRPEARSTGHYYLQLIPSVGSDEGGDWEHPLEQFRTRSRHRVVKKIEEWVHRDWSSRFNPKTK